MESSFVIDEVTHPCRLKLESDGKITLVVKNFGKVISAKRLYPNEIGDNYDAYLHHNEKIRCSKTQRCYAFKFEGNDTQYLYKFLTCPGRLFNMMCSYSRSL